MKRTTSTILLLLLFLVAACNGTSATNLQTDASPAPPFTLPNALGGNVSLSDYAGRPVFLFFHMAVG